MNYIGYIKKLEKLNKNLEKNLQEELKRENYIKKENEDNIKKI